MRLFLALDLPPALREALGSFQQELSRRAAGWRWMRAEGLHLTLRFLGEVREAAVGRQAEVWRAVAARGRPIHVAFRGIGVFPNERSPRVLWVGVAEEPPEGRLEALAADFEEAAASLGFPRDSRPFRPHLTVARASGRERPVVPDAGPIGDLGRARFEKVVLFRSVLGPDGASYTRLRVFRLGHEPCDR